MTWKNLYCESDHTTQDNLQIKCNPYQNINGMFQKTRKKKEICMEKPKTPNSQNNLEEKEQNQRNHASRFQIYYKATVNKIVVLAQKQVNGTEE